MQSRTDCQKGKPLNLFNNYLYEYKKGLRNLALYTGRSEEEDMAVRKLKNGNIAHYIHRVNGNKINIFFGDAECVNIIERMENRLFTDLTPEEDFILGIMLGYDRLKQCERYLRKKQPLQNKFPVIACGMRIEEKCRRSPKYRGLETAPTN